MTSERRNFIILRAFVTILVLAAGVGAFMALSSIKRAPKEKKIKEVEKTLAGVPVRLGPVNLTISGLGKALPVQNIILSSEVQGRIITKKTELKSGILVKKGEVLLEIDRSDYESNLHKAEAQIKRLVSDKAVKQRFVVDTEKQLQSIRRILELQTKNFNRLSNLLKKRASFQSELEDAEIEMHSQTQKVIDTSSALAKAKFELESLDAQIKSAEAELRLAKHNLRRCTVCSPINGRIKAAYVDSGEYVNAGTKLFELADDSQLEIPVSLNAAEVARVLPLQRISGNGHKNWFINPAGIPVEIQWVEEPELCKWSGEVVRLKEFNAETGTFTFIVSPTTPLVNSDQSFPLVEGMFCRVTFKGKTLPQAMLIPWIALQLDGEVFVADKQNRLEGRKVKVYCSNNDSLVITGGLKDGEKLVTQKLPRGVVNGMKVRIIPPDNDRFGGGTVELGPAVPQTARNDGGEVPKVKLPAAKSKI